MLGIRYGKHALDDRCVAELRDPPLGYVGKHRADELGYLGIRRTAAERLARV